MVQIIERRKKENSKSRRMRERGEHYAAYKAMCDEARSEARKIDNALSRLSGEPTGRVAKAISTTEYKMKPRSKPEQYTGSVCLPEVAIFAAGHRTSRKDAVHIFK